LILRIKIVSNSIYDATTLPHPVHNLYIWFPTDITDTAAFHQLLSNAAVYRSTKRRENLDTEDALTHHSKALSIVNGRLPDVAASISDGNMLAIASLCEYNVCIDDNEKEKKYRPAFQVDANL